MTSTWPRVLAVCTVLLGLGYATAAALVWRALDAAGAGVFLGGLSALVVAAGVGVWRGSAGAKAGATVAAFLGTALFGAAAVHAERDPDASDLVNTVDLAILYGLLALSTLVLTTAVVLAVIESVEARHHRAGPVA